MTHPTVERVDNRYRIRVDDELAGFTDITDPVDRDVLTWLAAGRPFPLSTRGWENR